ncbi:CHAT domain-containing protein [Mycobacterium sp. 050134]|uniref:CHAT domain-containing protein n=1 Tax=Mycobacterium sp. 050134 TaxID=3096111 RepID=UPI002EDB2992
MIAFAILIGAGTYLLVVLTLNHREHPPPAVAEQRGVIEPNILKIPPAPGEPPDSRGTYNLPTCWDLKAPAELVVGEGAEVKLVITPCPIGDLPNDVSAQATSESPDIDIAGPFHIERSQTKQSWTWRVTANAVGGHGMSIGVQSVDLVGLDGRIPVSIIAHNAKEGANKAGSFDAFKNGGVGVNTFAAVISSIATLITSVGSIIALRRTRANAALEPKHTAEPAPYTPDQEKITVLFVAAEPTDASHLQLGEELRGIQQMLQAARYRDRYRLVERFAARVADLTQAILEENPRIVHFSGHGTSAGAVCLESLTGEMQAVAPEALAALFRTAGGVECVLLNACFSAEQAEAIARAVPYVVGMKKAIGDPAAVAFAAGFYQALGAGKSIADAFAFGVVQLELLNIPESLTPQLIGSK